MQWSVACKNTVLERDILLPLVHLTTEKEANLLVGFFWFLDFTPTSLKGF